MSVCLAQQFLTDLEKILQIDCNQNLSTVLETALSQSCLTCIVKSNTGKNISSS
jgi:hypothetical protein